MTPYGQMLPSVEAPSPTDTTRVPTASLVLMFPGQSSADPHMILRARGLHPAATTVLDRAEHVLGRSALAPYTSPAGTRLQSNRDIQLAVFLATQMHLTALEAEGLAAGASVGLSLGEYSHLVHIGALTFEAALALVAERGAAYDTSPEGVMITVLGADRAQVEQATTLASVRRQGTVYVSNYNAPTQHVIAGTRAAAEAAAQWLEDECAAHTIETESRVPMHTPLLDGVAARFRPALESAPWQTPTGVYLSNVTSTPVAAAASGTLVDALSRHVTHPVRWQESIEHLAASRQNALFIEVGPGEVLHNMLGRRWLAVRRAATDQRQGDAGARFRATLEAARD